MKHLLLSFAAFAFAIGARAQSYVFDQSTLPYQPLTSPTPCQFDQNGFDDVTEFDGQAFDLFGFDYIAGTPYSMSIGDGGFLRFDGTSSSVIIDGLFTDLTPVDTSSTISYQISGTDGQLVLTVQWTNWHLSLGPAGNHASFQMAIDQATGIISVHTGPNSGGGMIFNNITGPNCGIFRANSSFTQCYGKLWVEGDPQMPTLDTQANLNFLALHAFPAEGTLYRFVPVAIAGIDVHALAPLHAYQAADGLHVELPAAQGELPLQLVDEAGRTVKEVIAHGTNTVIPTGDLPSGVYVVRPLGAALVPVRVCVP